MTPGFKGGNAPVNAAPASGAPAPAGDPPGPGSNWTYQGQPGAYRRLRARRRDGRQAGRHPHGPDAPLTAFRHDWRDPVRAVAAPWIQRRARAHK